MENLNAKYLVSNLLLGLALNIIAGVITFYVTQQIVYALALIIFIETIVIVLTLIKLSQTSNIVGIEGWKPTFIEGPSPLEMAQPATCEFVFWGISAKTLTADADFKKLMKERAKSLCKFRILILDPDYENIGQKAEEEGETAKQWIMEIKATKEFIKKLRDEDHPNIELRYYDQFPVFRSFFIDKRKMYFGWYGTGIPGSHSPLIIAKNEPRSLYTPIRMKFEETWDIARDAFLSAD